MNGLGPPTFTFSYSQSGRNKPRRAKKEVARLRLHVILSDLGVLLVSYQNITGFTFGLPTITALSFSPPSSTCIVHVVQPLVCPGVRWAVSFDPPSSTVSPSCKVQSTWASGRPRAVLSSSATSASINISFASVWLLTSRIASSWSPCAWLMRTI